MKISEIKGEHALSVLADILEPIGDIGKDENFIKAAKEKDLSKVVKICLKDHSKSVLTILALLNDKDVETYEPSLIELPVMLMELLQDEDFMSLFISQEQTSVKTSTGPATENIGAKEK